MTRLFSFSVLIFLAFILVACNSTQTPTAVLPADSNNNSNPAEANPPTTSGEMARTDAQGSVEFTVAPLNLDAPDETLAFTVIMDTHSVELSWDLAVQSVLTTDTGLEVAGLNWPVGSGHHVEGQLTFPAKTAEGQPLLAGAKTLTLTIRDAGADERVFEWEVLP